MIMLDHPLPQLLSVSGSQQAEAGVRAGALGALGDLGTTDLAIDKTKSGCGGDGESRDQ